MNIPEKKAKTAISPDAMKKGLKYLENEIPELSIAFTSELLAILEVNQTADKKTNKGYKVFVLLISGRPMNVADYIDDWDGFAAIWLPGSEGDGVSDILFGDYPSTGRLSYPWPIQAEKGANAKTSDLLFDVGFGL